MNNIKKGQELIQSIISLFIVFVFVIPLVVSFIIFLLILGKNLYLQIPSLLGILF